MSREYHKQQFMITTPALSFTEFNCLKEQGNQMGFLIGERKLTVSNVITDESMKNTITEESICVNSAFPVMDFVDTLCSNPLQVDAKKLKAFFQKCPENYETVVMGWYRFRRNAMLIPSVADIRFHIQLSAFFDKISIQSNKFLLCMFNHNFLGTVEHKFNHIFYRCANGKCLSPLKVEIVNMSTKPFIDTDNNSLGYKTNNDLIRNCKSYNDSTRSVFDVEYSETPRQTVYSLKNSLDNFMDRQLNEIVASESEVMRLNNLITLKTQDIELNKKIAKEKQFMKQSTEQSTEQSPEQLTELFTEQSPSSPE